MTNRKIAFFDIDGTLIHVPSQLTAPTEQTVKALQAFHEQGHLLVVATARGALPQALEKIPFDGFIGNDGHYIVFQNETLLDDLFTQADIRQQIQVYQQYHGRYMFSGHQACWTPNFNDELIQKHQMMFAGTTKKPAFLSETFEIEDIQALACCVLFENTTELYQAYEALQDQYTIVPYDTGLIRMDVYKKGFTKGTACRYLYEKLGIEQADSYAFGDGVNDIEMLQNVGHGVAMGNAEEAVKAIAKETTLSVLDDGIAVYFQNNIL